MPEKNLVMIDDDPFYHELYRELLQEEYTLFAATDLQSGYELISRHKPVALLLDVSLKGDKEEDVDNLGLEELPKIQDRFRGLPVIIFTGRNCIRTLRKSGILGAAGYFYKKDPVTSLFKLLEEVALPPVNITFREDRPIAVSVEMRNVLKQAKRFAATQEDVLITGASGSGKEILANYIRKHSDRAAGPFVVVNIAEFSKELIMDELVGHAKGAYTGAAEKREGRFEEAEGGIIFLDEIGELRLEDQARLLRIIEHKTISRIGENRLRKVNIRILAATNQDLESEINIGAFRKDLYYRLRPCQIKIPPLSERTADIIPLASYFLENTLQRNNLPQKKLTHNVLLMLKSYSWERNNVRELMNAVTEAAILSTGREIGKSLFNLPLPAGLSPGPLKAATKVYEKKLIRETLVLHHGNVTTTAKYLGISRQALAKKMHKLGLTLSAEEQGRN